MPIVIAVLSALQLLFSGGAAAADVCERLQAELAGLPRVVADTRSARKYASAIARQNIQLRKARSDMRRFGCGGGSIVVYGGANAEACATLKTVVGKMERNLHILEGKRREFASGVPTGGTRARLLASLERNGCNAAPVMTAAATETVRTLRDDEARALGFGMLPEGGERLGLRSAGGAAGHGNLRTVCVRTCDGGFFPISSGATPLDFRRDQKVCAMMCPQTETELFYHSLTNAQETEQMTSTVTGRPYSQLENAFAYRTRERAKGDACGCDLSAYYQEMIRREKAHRDGGADKAPAADPRREESGSITSIRSTLPLKGSVEARATPVERKERRYDPAASKVRVVGPLFLPADESAIDLGRPADAGVN